MLMADFRARTGEALKRSNVIYCLPACKTCSRVCASVCKCVRVRAPVCGFMVTLTSITDVNSLREEVKQIGREEWGQ